MKKNSFFVALIFVSLFAFVLCAGCAVPQVNCAKAGARSALEQQIVSKALRQSLGQTPNKKIPFEMLAGMSVSVEVACISRSGETGGCPEDARFVENMIIEKLVEANAKIAKRGEEEAAVRVIVETLGIDTTVRTFPHYYLPLFYYITYEAKSHLTIYAYDIKGGKRGMLLKYEGTGEESVSEWAALGLGPFR